MLSDKQIAMLAKVDEVLAEAKQLFPDCAGLSYANIGWCKGTTAGKAGYDRRKGGYYLMLNLQAVEEYFDDMLTGTIPHEVAHSIVQYRTVNGYYGYGRKIKPHGKEWRHVALALGDDASRCHTYTLSKARKVRKYVYALPLCGEIMVGAKHHNQIMGAAYNAIRVSFVTVKRTKERIMPYHYTGVMVDG